MRPILLPLLLALALSACTLRQFHDISLAPDGAPAELQALARDAQGGNKAAQFELAGRYERGEGVARNLRFAERLYEAAAEPINGTIYVYQPPVGSQRYGTVMPIRTGPDSPGLPEAIARLRALRAARGD